MAFNHGAVAIFTLADSTDAARDISTYLTQESLQRVIGQEDVTTQGQTTTPFYRSYIPGIAEGTIPLEGNYDPTVDGYLSGILGATTAKAWTYFPAGGTIGLTKPRYSGTAVLTRYEVRTGIGGKATITGTLQISGAVTRATA
jgi:hypothetical protein